MVCVYKPHSFWKYVILNSAYDHALWSYSLTGIFPFWDIPSESHLKFIWLYIPNDSRFTNWFMPTAPIKWGFNHHWLKMVLNQMFSFLWRLPLCLRKIEALSFLDEHLIPEYVLSNPKAGTWTVSIVQSIKKSLNRLRFCYTASDWLCSTVTYRPLYGHVV